MALKVLMLRKRITDANAALEELRGKASEFERREAELETSINYAKDNAAEAGKLCETHGIVPKAPLATKAIPNCNLTFISGDDMKPAIEGYFGVLFAANKTSVGGAIPDEGFYYIP